MKADRFQNMKDTAFLRGWSLLNVPLIYACSPSVVELNDNRCVVKIPLSRKTRNHLKSMYFGTLCIGADVAGGLMAMRLIQKNNPNISLVFKDVKADFLKRPTANVYFTCSDGPAITDLVARAEKSGERENLPVKITATCPSVDPNEPVAEFVLTLSIKKKSKKVKVDR